jgi:membrane-associated phospholipid phosphatase
MAEVWVTVFAGLIAGVGMAALMVAAPRAQRLLAPRIAPDTLTSEVHRHRRLRHFLRWGVDPAHATDALFPAAALIVVVGFVAVGLLLAMIRAHWGFADFDRSAAKWAAVHASAGSTHLLRLFTQLGGAVVLVPIAVVVAGFETWRQRRWEIVAFLAATVGGQYLVVYLIKTAVDRTRPSVLRLTGFSGPSFPSGHATAAAAAFAGFALVATRTRGQRSRPFVGGVAAGLAVSVATTRVLLGVHWLTDVLAGLCLGWAWFALCSIAFGGRMLRYGAPVAAAEQLAAR